MRGAGARRSSVPPACTQDPRQLICATWHGPPAHAMRFPPTFASAHALPVQPPSPPAPPHARTSGGACVGPVAPQPPAVCPALPA
eukprot:3923486-Prymnesium_polylepis.1